MTEPTTDHGLSIHRSEALTDGIYAVAMTLLVIELKLPDHKLIHSPADVTLALVELGPKLQAWVISFFVLAIFWMGHYRSHSHLRRADNSLVWLNVCQLAFVSLMPFSCALLGEHAGVLSQAVYSANMAMLAVFALLTARYIHRHPELSAAPLSAAAYNGVRIRIGGLIVISLVAVLIQMAVGDGGNGIANIAFALMTIISPLSRRVERASGPAVPDPAPR
jgi:uncharacterized membrane protein